MNHAISLGGEPWPLRWRAAWRLRRLTSDRTRGRLADGLARAVDEAMFPSQAVGAAIPVQRIAVLTCHEELLELAERLRGPGVAYAQGVALAANLLANADSPLYQSDSDLKGAVEDALAALDGHLH